jgi:hypothetical protein
MQLSGYYIKLKVHQLPIIIFTLSVGCSEYKHNPVFLKLPCQKWSS